MKCYVTLGLTHKKMKSYVCNIQTLFLVTWPT